MPFQPGDNTIRLTRAHERRMGKSMLPLRISTYAKNSYKVFDPENKSWTCWKDTGKRLVRIYENDDINE